MNNSFIFGKSTLARIIGAEVYFNNLHVWVLGEDGHTVTKKTYPYNPWLLSNEAHTKDWERLEGNLHYKYLREFNSTRELWETKKMFPGDYYQIYDEKEASAVRLGYTFYRELKPLDIPTLAFDIESTSLNQGPEAKVLLIANTFRRGSHLERKLFRYSDYPDERALFDAWSKWVVEMDPAIIVGHNIYDYDLPYMDYCARRAGTSLKIGREGKPITFNKFESRFRKDGSNFFMFNGINIWGREIVDTYFLAMKSDISKKYPSYGLKAIIKVEGKEVPGRQFYDASKIAQNYKIPSEWELIQKYAENDGDDALTLFDLFIPSLFYLARSVPFGLTNMVNRASGSQINSFLVRGYLQDGHSIPKASETNSFEGALSHGNPGVYHECYKVDVASMYPSIVINFKVYNPEKDPKGYVLKMTEYFTAERLHNKKLGKETGERYYKDLEQSQKIVINSVYGFMGAPGLNFNSPFHASEVTRHGRESLQKAMDWATSQGYQLVNYDTDSIMISNHGRPITDIDKKNILTTLNSQGPLRWEDDGTYRDVLVVATKNYYMVKEDGKVVLKGSALKAPLKPPAVREFLQKVIEDLLNGRDVMNTYKQYGREILSIDTKEKMTRWVSKFTVTENVMKSGEPAMLNLRNAIKGTEYRVGDKCFKFKDKENRQVLLEHWNHNHDPMDLLEGIHSTLATFDTILDMKKYPKYTLKRNKTLLLDLTNSIERSKNINI